MTFSASNLQKTLRNWEVNPASDEYIAVICNLNNLVCLYVRSVLLKCVIDDLICHSKLFTKAMG